MTDGSRDRYSQLNTELTPWNPVTEFGGVMSKAVKTVLVKPTKTADWTRGSS